MRLGLRSHFLLLLACVAVLGGLAGYRFYAWYSGEIVTVFGQRFAERNVLYEKSRVQGMVTREVTLVEKMANSHVLKTWLVNENDPADLTFYEEWESADDLAAHSQSEHLAIGRKKLEGLLEKPADVRKYSLLK